MNQPPAFSSAGTTVPAISFGELSDDAIRVMRARPGTYLVVALLCMFPSMVMSLASLLADWERLAQVMATGNMMLMAQPNRVAQALQILSYPVTILGLATGSALITRLGLDDLDGQPKPVADVLWSCGRPILWMTFMDTVLAIVVYVGCICCLVPGIAMAIFVVMNLSLQTSVLVDRPVHWFDAANQSYRQSQRDGGLMLGLGATYVGVLMALGFVTFMIGGGVFLAANGGMDVAKESFGRSVAIAYSVAMLLSLVPSTSAWVWWVLAKASAYHRLNRFATGARVAAVFA